MPYNDQTEYPRGMFTKNNLASTPQDVGTAGVDQKVSHWIARGGAATRVLTFRNSAGTQTYFTIELSADEMLVVPRGFHTTGGGLEVLTDSATADVFITIWYYV